MEQTHPSPASRDPTRDHVTVTGETPGGRPTNCPAAGSDVTDNDVNARRLETLQVRHNEETVDSRPRPACISMNSNIFVSCLKIGRRYSGVFAVIMSIFAVSYVEKVVISHIVNSLGLLDRISPNFVAMQRFIPFSIAKSELRYCNNSVSKCQHDE